MGGSKDGVAKCCAKVWASVPLATPYEPILTGWAQWHVF